jgi:hypothetical protein
MEYSVLNKTECMEKCVDASPECKSILYLDQPKECIFSKEKKMKSSRDNVANYDIYTIKNKNGNKGKNNKIISQKPNIVNEIAQDIKTELALDNIIPKYTECEKYSDTDNLLTIKKAYNKSCKENFGDEYIFDDNVFDKKTIIRCNENDTIKVKCKMSYLDNTLNDEIETNFNDDNTMIEMFENMDNKNLMERNQNIIYVASFLILLIIFIVFMMCK